MLKVWHFTFKGRGYSKVYSDSSDERELLRWAASFGFGREVIHYSRKRQVPHIDLSKSRYLAKNLPVATRRQMLEDLI
jgi:hypothetical protein